MVKYFRQGMSYATENLRFEQSAPLNFQMPTLGGKQLWRDDFVYAGWRIQSNLFSGHSRLLAPDDMRYAWGGYEDCLGVFKKIKAEEQINAPIDPKEGGIHLVLMVHGITRSGDTFTRMKPIFAAQGLEVAAITYPSTRAYIQDHANQLDQLLNRRPDVRKVSFVTHSMGGLIVRELLSLENKWKTHTALGRIVMIAPPNQGSIVAEYIKQRMLYQLIYGKSGQELVPDIAQTLPVPLCELGIIAGGKSDGRGYNPLLVGDDDGVVTVAEAKLSGCDDFIVLPGLHSSMCNQTEVISAALNYIQVGNLGL
ncbi:esterase/lipase family protein [Kiloniella antarctica]|uniref:Esterase/lipase family protein n=1 Tax=Kiloniella antarctica TaxID=1550907 RepID=A0ABW5BI93_9PROT